MVAALLPALQAGGSALIAASPKIVDKVKAMFPSAYNVAKTTLGLSQTTPEQVAGQAAKTNNAMMTNALLGTLVKSGVPPGWIRDHFPVLTQTDVTWLENAYADITVLERSMSTKPEIKGDPDVLLGHMIRTVETTCRMLGITSDQLADLLAFLATHGANDIKRYQKFKIGTGTRPI